MKIKTEPIQYQVLVKDITRQIKTGCLKPGERLCSLRTMAQQYKLSVAIVRKSFDLLEKDGLLVQRHGSGTFVNPALKTKGNKMIALLTSFKEKSFENYFESLFSEAVDLNVIPIVGVIDEEKDWKDTIKKIIMKEPDVFLIDVEARHFKLKELLEACAPIACSFVNRWEWFDEKPARAVLSDYPAAYTKAINYLKERGHDRILVLGHHNPPYSFMREYFKLVTASVSMEFGKELLYASIGDIEKTPGLIKKIFSKNAPTGVFGLSDYIVYQFSQQVTKISRSVSNIDKIGIFNQSYSNIPGHEFASIRFDFQKIWKSIFRHCNNNEDLFVEYIEPEILTKQG